MIQVTITRASLSLSDLVIGNTATAGANAFWLPEDGIEEPDITFRYTYAPDSPDMHGKSLLQAVKEHASMPLTIYTQATTAAQLKANKTTLAAALGQFTYSTQLLVNGEGYTHSSDPCAPKWNAFDSGMARAHMARANVVIPVFPIGA